VKSRRRHPHHFTISERIIQDLDMTPKIKVVTVPKQSDNQGAKEAAMAKPDGCTLFTTLQITITSYLNGQIKYH
jgi:hypothetical protein